MRARAQCFYFELIYGTISGTFEAGTISALCPGRSSPRWQSPVYDYTEIDER